jgi:hypothetical protein
MHFDRYTLRLALPQETLERVVARSRRRRRRGNVVVENHVY